MDPKNMPQWATLDVSEDEPVSNNSEAEDDVDEIQKTSSPAQITNVIKRSRDVLAGPSERPQKRRRHSSGEGGSSSGVGRGAQPANSFPRRGPVLGSYIRAGVQPVANPRRNESTKHPAQRKADTSQDDSDSGSSSIMIIDKAEANRASTSQNVPKQSAAKPSNAPARKSKSDVDTISGSSSGDDETSSSSPVRAPTQRVARKSVRGVPPNVKGKESANPPPTPQAAKGTEPSNAPPPSKGKEPVKPPPSDIIEVSSDDDSDEVVIRPFKQVARKKTGAAPPGRVKIRSRVSDTEPKASSSVSGNAASQSVSALPGGQKAPEVGWTDFFNMLNKTSKTTNVGPSTSRAKADSANQPARSSVSVKTALKSPQKVPSSTLDSYVERGKRPVRPAATSSGANEDVDVDMRPLSEALPLPKKSLATRKEEARKEIRVLEKKVSALTNPKPSSFGDVAAAIEQAGRNNAQTFATSKKVKTKRASIPTPSVGIDPTKGISVDAPIDLTLSDDEVPPHPRREASNPHMSNAATVPPLPSRNASGARPTGSDAQSAPPNAATTPPPAVSMSTDTAPPMSAPPLPSRASIVAGTKSTAPPRSSVLSAPHLAAAQRSPTRRHSMPSASAASSSETDQSVSHAVTRIASPVPLQDQTSSAPPASPISVASSVPSRAMTPQPVEPLSKLLSPPPLDASHVINGSTVQSTPLASQPVSLPRAPLPSLLPPQAPTDVPHNQTTVDSLFTDDESEGEMSHHIPPIDSLFSDAEDEDSHTTTNRSDAEAAMEVEALVEPATRDVSYELDDVTQALGTQTLKTASPSEASTASDANRPSFSRPITPAAPSDDGFDDFYVSDSDDPLALTKDTAPLASSGPVSSLGSEPRTPEDTQDLPVAVAGKSYGGFAALTFDNWRDEYQVEVNYIEELPVEFHSYINDRDEHYRMSGDLRQLLQASISYNTREEEPDAPPIEIINHIDDEPTPPWEFYYTNKMYHGPNVPPPDVANLKGCDCVGKCDPRSKTCQCLAKQKEWFIANGSDLQGFMYDKQRRLKPRFGGFPIQECNDLCGCDEDCMNRVVQRGRTVQVSIQKTEKKGWGVFAGPKKIPRGTFLGVYAGEILTSDDGEQRGMTYEQWGRTYLFDIDFYYLDDSSEAYTIDAYHAGNFTRFLNHSCDPNARLYPCYVNEACLAKALLVVFATKDIEPHEEICFCYTGNYPEDEDGPEKKNVEAPLIKRAEWKTCYCGAANCNGAMFA